MVAAVTPQPAAAGSDYVTRPGWYHAIIQDALEGVRPDGQPFAGFVLVLAILDGEPRDGDACAEADRVYTLYLGNPAPTHKDGGKFFLRRQTAALLAADLITPEQLGGSVDVELAQAKHRQILVRLVSDTRPDGRTFMVLGGTDVCHVDDPRAAECPKLTVALGAIPPERRHGPEWFEAAKKRDR